MQVPTPSPTNVVLDVVRSPAMVIGACAVFVRWVLAPAITNYIRHELQSELSELGKFPLFVERVTAVESAIERLSGVAEALARIEEQIKSIDRERRTHPDRRAPQDV